MNVRRSVENIILKVHSYSTFNMFFLFSYLSGDTVFVLYKRELCTCVRLTDVSSEQFKLSSFVLE